MALTSQDECHHDARPGREQEHEANTGQGIAPMLRLKNASCIWITSCNGRIEFNNS